MKKKYEDACRQENLSKEKTRKIDQVFNTDYKRMQREREYREEHGIVFNSLSAMAAGDYDTDEMGDYEIADSSGDPMEKLIADWDEKEKEIKLSVLQECLSELPPEEKEILLTYYGGSYGIESKMARDLGMERKAFIRLRQRLLARVQEMFFEKWEG